MSQIFNHCPSCQQSQIYASHLKCGNCETHFEGQFHIPNLLKLSPGEMEFIMNFVKASGSLKEMARIKGVSYPTLRNQLNQLIEKVSSLELNTQNLESEILNQLEQGEINAKTAAKKLAALKRDS